MIGSLFSFEAERVARSLAHRVVWVGTAVLLLVLMTVSFTFSSSSTNRIQGAATFARNFFLVFAWVQMILVCALTPAYVAGLIAHLKEQKALDLLLISRLSSWELVTSIVLPRVGSLLLGLFAGMAVLMFSTILGGIVPGHVVVTYALAISFLACLTGISVLCSVFSRRARDAMLLAYIVDVFLILQAMLLPIPQPLVVRGIGDLPHLLISARHPFDILVKLESGDLDSFAVLALPTIGLYLLVGITTFLLACLLVRVGHRQRRGATRLGRTRKPLLDQNPVYWREKLPSNTSAVGRIGGLSLLVLSGFSLLYCGLGTYEHLVSRAVSELPFRLAIFMVALGLLHLVLVAIRGACSMPNERENNSLDVLLATPLTANEIVVGKIRSAAIGYPVLPVTMVLCWVTGSIAVPSALLFLPILLLELVMFSYLAAAIGFRVGMLENSGGKAAFKAMALIVVGSLVSAPCCLSVGGSASPISAFAVVSLTAFDEDIARGMVVSVFATLLVYGYLSSVLVSYNQSLMQTAIRPD